MMTGQSDWTNEGIPIYRGPGKAPRKSSKYRSPRECVDNALTNWYAEKGDAADAPKIAWVEAETGLPYTTAADNLRAALADRAN
jgi:hypothetical protein